MCSAFLAGRLFEQDTLNWAIRLPRGAVGQRAAVIDALVRAEGTLKEPWSSAWRLLEESWSTDVSVDADRDKYQVANRIAAGERSGSLVRAIADLVRPYLEVLPAAAQGSARGRAQSMHELLRAQISSGALVDPHELHVSSVQHKQFLTELCHELEFAVSRTYSLAERVFGTGGAHLWRLGELHRVKFVREDERPEGEHEPDEFGEGVAPAVKLLHAAVAQLATIDSSAAGGFWLRWRERGDPLHLRLWAEVAAGTAIPAIQVEDFLLNSSDEEFWDLHGYPEVAQLRVRRFSELSGRGQESILARLRKGPPASHWPRRADRTQVAKARRYWTARELRRLQLAGAALPDADHAFLNRGEFDDVRLMKRLDEGFLGTQQARVVAPRPDSGFDLLEGAARVSGLDSALAEGRGGRGEGTARGAIDWLRIPQNLGRVFADIEGLSRPDYPTVLAQLFRTHRPSEGQSAEHALRDARRASMLILRLEEGTIDAIIGPISSWVQAWSQQLSESLLFRDLWTRVWPAAVKDTDSQQDEADDTSLNSVARSSDEEPRDLDTLNTSVGILAGAFLGVCPPADQQPFLDANLRAIRDELISTSGRSGLIVRHRFVEHLWYFWRSDEIWTRLHLVDPLLENNSNAVMLWRSVAKRTLFNAPLRIIGSAAARWATDLRLGRRSRGSLVFSLVVESLHAFMERREPAVHHATVQQMLRSIEDEIRPRAAGAVRQFVSELGSDGSSTPEAVFRSAAEPFLSSVWPQETSLSTPGVARAFCMLPAVCGDEFATAVSLVQRFVVPFDCWSLVDFGLYGGHGDQSKLHALVNTREKAEAFLTLLNRAVGTNEGAVFPTNLGSVLSHIHRLSPRIASQPAFRRLGALARTSE